tara:strand:+ start:2470 stop:3840 length:1371 start_codon:yes stop_codon:yes gene_type:complete
MADTLIDILREYIPRKKQVEIELSHSINNKYTCANPSGPVSNVFCPEEDPLCACPCKDIIPKAAKVVTMQWALDNIYEFSSNDVTKINDEAENSENSLWVTIKEVYEDKGTDDGAETPGGNNPVYELFPDGSLCFHETEDEAIEKITAEYQSYVGGYTMDEPTKPYMDLLLKKSSECSHIESEFGESWLGCDWNEPNSPMSCGCPCVGEDYYKYLRYNTSVATFWDTPPDIPLLSKGQRAAIQSQKIGVTVYGDLSVRPGDIIKLNITDTQLSDAAEILDNLARKYGLLTSTDRHAKFQGHWMVFQINHRILGLSHHKMDLILVRDGLPAMDEGAEEEDGSSELYSSFDNFQPINVERVFEVSNQTSGEEEQQDQEFDLDESPPDPDGELDYLNFESEESIPPEIKLPEEGVPASSEIDSEENEDQQESTEETPAEDSSTDDPEPPSSPSGYSSGY